MKCGDLYKEQVLTEFQVCAISEKKCIPQRSEDTSALIPTPSALTDNFTHLERYSGNWYITHGLNPIFDCFDCQKHIVTGTGSQLILDVQYEVRPQSSSSSANDQGFTRQLRQVHCLHV
jgi:hypothetical protein